MPRDFIIFCPFFRYYWCEIFFKKLYIFRGEFFFTGRYNLAQCFFVATLFLPPAESVPLNQKNKKGKEKRKLWITRLDVGGDTDYTYYNYMINLQTTKIVRVGTSLAVVIPINILRDLGIERGDHVAFAVAEGDVICMRKITDAEKLEIKPQIIKLK
jgi:antitoxin component of MazEF toxin-antitoxin module